MVGFLDQGSQNQSQSSDIGRVYLVDDDRLLLTSLEALLDAAGFETVSCASAEDFLALPIEYLPSCIVLDMKMDGISGHRLQELLEARDFVPPIVFLSGEATLDDAVKALRKGAHHFLTKPVSDTELITVVTEAIEHSQEDADFFAFCEQLTETERDVAMLVRKGMLSKQIAAELGKSVRTIEWHRQNILDKQLGR